MNRFSVVAMVVATIPVAGCSGQGDAPREDRAGGQKPRTVVVNGGMSKEEELNERLAELEEGDDQSAGEQPTQETESAEEAARTVAEDYYAAAASGNYGYTYEELSSYSQS